MHRLRWQSPSAAESTANPAPTRGAGAGQPPSLSSPDGPHPDHQRCAQRSSPTPISAPATGRICSVASGSSRRSPRRSRAATGWCCSATRSSFATGPWSARSRPRNHSSSGSATALAGGEVVLVPGNHDHRLLGHWLERVRDRSADVSLDELVAAPHPMVRRIEEWLGAASLTLRYPGTWIREDVFATHGHYLDSHITLPTVERLSIATVDRIGGRPTGIRAAPQDYEKVHAPVYDLLFDLAQGGRNPHAQSTDGAPSMRIWEMIGGASGRARNWRGRAAPLRRDSRRPEGVRARRPRVLRTRLLRRRDRPFGGRGDACRRRPPRDRGRARDLRPHPPAGSAAGRGRRRRDRPGVGAAGNDAPQHRLLDLLAGDARTRLRPEPVLAGPDVFVNDSGPPEAVELLAEVRNEDLDGSAEAG